MYKINQKGYALLFTVIIVSIVSLLAFGLSSTTLKQLVLSLGARDSQIAFFQSDMAIECGLYASINGNIYTNGVFKCGVDKDGKENVFIINGPVIKNNETIYTIEPPGNSENKSKDPCFVISVTEKDTTDSIDTKVEGSGYNICDKTNTRTVERTIEANF